VKPTNFLNIHSDIWPIVMPEDSTNKVMAETTSWESVESDLNRVISSSMLGKRLFSFAIKQMLSQIVSKTIEAAVAEMWKKPEITLAVIRDAKRKTLEALQEMDNIELLPPRRELLLEYRGAPVTVKVNSLAEQFDMLVAALVKGEAAQCGTLPGLFCEEDLVVKNALPKAKNSHINEEVLQEAKEARALANGLLHGDSCKDGDTICVTSLAACKLPALALPCCFAFFVALVLAGAQHSMQCMPWLLCMESLCQWFWLLLYGIACIRMASSVAHTVNLSCTGWCQSWECAVWKSGV
jgi:hypothetical protein